MAELKRTKRKNSGLPAPKGALSPVKRKHALTHNGHVGSTCSRKLRRKRGNTVTAHTLPPELRELAQGLHPASYLLELGRSGAAQGSAFLAGVATVPRDEGRISSEVWISSRS